MNSYKEAPPSSQAPTARLETSEYGVPAELWQIVVQRVVEQKEPLRTVAAAYGVSHETIRRIMLQVQMQRGQQDT